MCNWAECCTAPLLGKCSGLIEMMGGEWVVGGGYIHGVRAQYVAPVGFFHF